MAFVMKKSFRNILIIILLKKKKIVKEKKRKNGNILRLGKLFANFGDLEVILSAGVARTRLLNSKRRCI